MGIDVIDDCWVVFNRDHDNLVVTCANKNPTELMLDGMRTQSIFRRVKAKVRSGDGNPLIYALKGKKNFRINPKEVSCFLPDFNLILSKAMLGANFDLIVPMPSSHGISEILAKRAVRVIRTGVLSSDLLRKKINREVLAEIRNTNFHKRHRFLAKTLRRRLEKSNGASSFSMKDVDNKLRTYIEPMVITQSPQVAPSRILLVDDLISSGATLCSARDSLLTVFPDAHIEGLSLLSKIKSR